ncbi:MAG: hypothetical protein ACI9WC_001389 [Arenicella sp.]|jgi:hypothetical protein
MKGILFVEFIDFLEMHTDVGTAQEIINQAELDSLGAYSRVGLYDYQELIKLLVSAANRLDCSADELLEGYTEHLMSMFHRDYPAFFEDATCAGDILKNLDSHIHVQVQKLYPDAELPSFDYQVIDGRIHLEYKSPRPLAAVAQSLTLACIKHFATGERIIDAQIAENGKSAKFIIEKIE